MNDKAIKSELFELRKQVLTNDSSDIEHALNHALQYVNSPSPESLKWVKYYLDLHINQRKSALVMVQDKDGTDTHRILDQLFTS